MRVLALLGSALILKKLRVPLVASMFALAALPVAAQEFVGLIHARHDLTLSLGVPGLVSKVMVRPGSRVAAGQPLLQLDEKAQATEVDRRKTIMEDLSELKATESRVKLMQPMIEDTRKLAANRGSISRDELTRMELEFTAALGRLQQLQVQKQRERLEFELSELERQQRRLVAPVSGVVTRVNIEAGEWARPGEPVMHLVDASVSELRVNVPYTLVRGLRAGSRLPVKFETESGLAPVQGTVSYVAPVVDPASGLVDLRVSFANAKGAVPAGIKGIVSLNDKGAAR